MIAARFTAIAGTIFLLSAAPVMAADNFNVSATSNGSTSSLGFSSAEQALNQLTNNQLSLTLPTYTITSAANALINYRGLNVTASYPVNSTALNFAIPALGINQTFTGVTRNDSQNQLVNYLKTNGIYGRVLNALAAVSPTEPLAGNPTSLMSQMVGRDFSVAFGGENGSVLTPGQRGGEVGLGLAFSHFTQGGVPVDSYTLPLSYSYRFDRDPRYVLTVEAPISYSSVGNAQAGAISLGVSLSIPVSDQWTVTPKISTGAEASIDLASAGALVAGSVTSSYRFKVAGIDFVLGDMAGVAQSLPLSFGQYSVSPNLTNEYFKNGIMVARPLSLMGIQVPFLERAEAQAWVTDTRFFGSKLYDDSYQEVGVSVGKPIALVGRFVRLGLSYFHSHHSDGGMANFGYSF